MEPENGIPADGTNHFAALKKNDIVDQDSQAKETNSGAPKALSPSMKESFPFTEKKAQNETESASENNAAKGDLSEKTEESLLVTDSQPKGKDDAETVKSVKKTKNKKSVVALDSELKESEGSEKEDGEEVVNVNQYYPEVDILTSTLTSDCNVAETEDHKFGGEELPPPEKQITESPPQILAITDDGEENDRDTGAASVASTELPSQREADNSTESGIPVVNGFGVFAATQLPGEEEEPVRRPPRSISPEYDAVHIIKTKVTEHANLATTHQMEGNYEQALRAISKGMGLKSNQSTNYIQRAEIFLQLCDFQSAILNYKKACFLEPENNVLYERLAFIFYFQGQVFFDQRLFAEALESFSRASEMLPDTTGFHTRSIACLAALQRHGECLALVNHRLEVDKHNPDLYIMRARLHEMFNNMTLCYYDIKDALALDEDHPEALALRTRMEVKAEENKLHSLQLSILGKNRESLQKMNIAIEMNPAVAEYHILRGALHRKLGDFNSAIDDFLLALDKADHLEDSEVYLDSQRQLLLTYNDFAVECFTKGYYEEAILLLNKAIKGEKEEKGLYINRGDCFFRQGELTFALQDYHQAMELDRLDTDVRSRISIIHSEFGVTAYHNKNYPEAESKFSLAIQYNPSVGQYYITRSRCRYMLEDMAGARQDLVMGMLLDPTNEEIISILSRLFPGKSVKEITDSEMGRAAKQALGNLSPMASPIRLQPIPQTPALVPLPQDAGIERAASGIKPSTSHEKTWTKSATFDLNSTDPKGKCQPSRDSQSAARMKLQTPQLWSQITKEKKMIKDQIKKGLHDRKSLKYNGPRLKPLPPRDDPITESQSATEKVDSPVFGGGKSTNWRKFGVGMGGLKAL